MTSESDDLLTTGQAAAILGVTPKHVVNLCDRGELAFTTAGTHRRIRRGDVLALTARGSGSNGGPMTVDQVRSLWLHRAAAAHVARDPSRSLEQARTWIGTALAREPDGARWLRQWLAVIDRGPEAVMRTMTAIDPLARELRQNSPWLAMLPERERTRILAAFRRTNMTGGVGR